MVPRIQHQVRRGSAIETVDGKGHLAFQFGIVLIRRYDADRHIDAGLLGIIAEDGGQPLAGRISARHVQVVSETLSQTRLRQKLVDAGMSAPSMGMSLRK